MAWRPGPLRLTLAACGAGLLLAGCGASAAAPPSGAAMGANPTGASATTSDAAAVESPPTASATPSSSAKPSTARPGVYAIGDSVMLGARSCLEKRGYVVNAQGSRQASAVATVLRHRRDRLPANVVVHTGTNGGATAADLRRIVKAVGPGHEIYFVTVQLPENGKYTFEARTNAAIEKVAKRFPNVHVADWNKRSNGHGRLTYGDGIHLPPAGCRAFAHVVADALRDA